VVNKEACEQTVRKIEVEAKIAILKSIIEKIEL